MIDKLPRREREVFEILCRLGAASTADVREHLSDELSDSAVRTLLSRLETRGVVRREGEAPPFMYATTQRPAEVRASALKQIVDNLFDGSGVSAATALLGQSKRLTDEEAKILQAAIEAARKRK